MREIITENIKVGEHVLIDGVEYATEKYDSNCSECELYKSGDCGYINCNGVIFKKVKKEPQYRPYKDTDEMIEDYKERFNVNNVPAFCLPLIWVTHTKVESMKSFKTLITGFGKNCVLIYDVARHLQTLFDEFAYLDGSPCGKVEE